MKSVFVWNTRWRHARSRGETKYRWDTSLYLENAVCYQIQGFAPCLFDGWIQKCLGHTLLNVPGKQLYDRNNILKFYKYFADIHRSLMPIGHNKIFHILWIPIHFKATHTYTVCNNFIRSCTHVFATSYCPTRGPILVLHLCSKREGRGAVQWARIALEQKSRGFSCTPELAEI